jgi:hypothetical protein
VRHHQIEDDDVVLAQSELQHRLETVRCFLDALAVPAKDHPNEAANRRIILDDENVVLFNDFHPRTRETARAKIMTS